MHTDVHSGKVWVIVGAKDMKDIIPNKNDILGFNMHGLHGISVGMNAVLLGSFNTFPKTTLHIDELKKEFYKNLGNVKQLRVIK